MVISTFKTCDNKFLITLTLLFLMAAIMGGCGSSKKTIPENEPPVQPKPEEPAKAEQPSGTERPAEPKKTPTPDTPETIEEPDHIPETPREMRAVWVATVANIDWPSEPGLPVAQQKAELRALMDRAKQLNMNAIILQVRPAADALYDSPYEPWSEFLTGKQGRPPEPYYDPLAFAIDEAHRRGLELHAWFNPFRAYHPVGESEFAPSHIRMERPELVQKYGRYWWIDPGWKAARQYSRKIILDVAKRYDIDGVHLDDYFYPYAEVDSKGQNIPFPDNASYRAYLRKHENISKADWRRQNINQFIKKLNEELKTIRPHIRFGISPFGIWRPGNPPQIKGFDAYANLYADAKKWFNKGWVDYLAPQLYWEIDKREQSFPVLLNWWQQQNTYNRHLWPGLYTSRVGRTWEAEEISRQIQITRKQTGVTGQIHFSMQAIMNNEGGIADQLMTTVYDQPALVPASPWLSTKRPEQPQASLKELGNHYVVSLSTDRTETPWLWVTKIRYGNRWKIRIVPGWKQSIMLPKDNTNGALKGVAVSTVNEVGIESTEQMLLPTLKQVE